MESLIANLVGFGTLSVVLAGFTGYMIASIRGNLDDNGVTGETDEEIAAMLETA